jgi:hypothetical protein
MPTPTVAKKLAWPDTNGTAGASNTLKYHQSDPYGGYSMVWWQLIWYHDDKWGIVLVPI